MGSRCPRRTFQPRGHGAANRRGPGSPGVDPDSAPGPRRAPAELTDKAHSLPALLTGQKPTWAGLGKGNPGEEERQGLETG